MKRLLGVFALAILAGASANAGTINVTPGNVGQVVVPANAGSTFNFSPGNYTFLTNATGPAADWSQVPGTFVGNGAVFALSTGISTNEQEELVKFAPGSTVSGFVFTDAQIHCEAGTFSITGNTFESTYRGIFVASNSGNFDGNVITNTTAEGIYGYPGSNCTYDDNVISNTGNDGIHLVGSPNSVMLYGNTITGCQRIGIELQNAFTNLTVENNYVAIIQPTAPNSYMAYSIATGSGSNITVSGNTGVSNRVGAGACIEIMGNNPTIASNLSWGFGEFILNGGQGSAVTTNNNIVYGGVFSANDSVSWTIAPIVSTSDTNPPLSITAIAAPAPPPTTPSAPPTIPTAPVTTPPSSGSGSSTGSSGSTGSTTGSSGSSSGNTGTKGSLRRHHGSTSTATTVSTGGASIASPATTSSTTNTPTTAPSSPGSGSGYGYNGSWGDGGSGGGQ